MIKLNKQYNFLLNLISNYKKNIFIICIFLIASTLINLIFPLISKKIMDEGFIGKDFDLLIKLILFVFFLRLLDQGLEWTKENIRINIQTNVKKTLWDKAFSHILNIKLEYFDINNDAQIINNLYTDVDNISNIFDGATIFVITQIFSVIGGLIGLFIINPTLTIIVILFAPVKYFIVRYFTSKREEKVNEYIKENEEYTKWLSGTISGIKETRIFGLQNQKKKEFNDRQESILNSGRLMEIISIKNNISDILLAQFLSTSLYIIGAIKVFDTSMTIGGIFSFLSYSVYVTTPISAILNIKFFLSGIIPSTKRFMEYFEVSCENDEGSQSAVNGDITFDNVSFAYKEEDKNIENKSEKIFDNLNLSIKKNEKIAIIGENGSGKSTLLKLLLRFYEVSNGTIYIGNANICDFSLESYRNLFSVVSQDVYLFNDTLRNNIVLNKTMSEDEIIEILDKVNLKQFVEEKTLDYIVGENGSMLSGGQKQKVAFARALAKDTPIILFDEATSNSDIEFKKEFMNIIENQLQEKTVIMITHNTDDLKENFKIYELKNKQITLKNMVN